MEKKVILNADQLSELARNYFKGSKTCDDCGARSNSRVSIKEGLCNACRAPTNDETPLIERMFEQKKEQMMAAIKEQERLANLERIRIEKEQERISSLAPKSMLDIEEGSWG